MSKPKYKALPGAFYLTDFPRASSKEEMLALIRKYPGIDPYAAAGGIVRGVTIDRWCNELLRAGLIEGWEENNITSCWAKP